MTLRPYQYYVVEAVLETVERGSTMETGTTGSGKTLQALGVDFERRGY